MEGGWSFCVGETRGITGDLHAQRCPYQKHCPTSVSSVPLKWCSYSYFAQCVGALVLDLRRSSQWTLTGYETTLLVAKNCSVHTYTTRTLAGGCGCGL